MKKKQFYLLLSLFSMLFIGLFIHEKTRKVDFSSDVELTPDLAKKDLPAKNSKSKISTPKTSPESRVPASNDSRTPASIESLQLEKVDKTFILQTLQVYNEQMQYESTTLPIDPQKGADPLERHTVTSSTWMPSIDGTHLYIKLTSDKIQYGLDEVIQFQLDATFDNRPIDIALQAELLNSKMEMLQKIDFELAKPAGHYISRLNSSNLSSDLYIVKVKVKNKGTIQEEASALHTFTVLHDGAKFKKVQKDYLSADKNLNFDALFEIAKAGSYLLEGVLYDSKDRPIASYEKVFFLEEGEQIASLSFDGYLLFSQKYSGPFELRNLSLSQLNNDLTMKRGLVYTVEKKSHSYEWSEFRSIPVINKTMQAKAEELKEML